MIDYNMYILYFGFTPCFTDLRDAKIQYDMMEVTAVTP